MPNKPTDSFPKLISLVAGSTDKNWELELECWLTPALQPSGIGYCDPAIKRVPPETGAHAVQGQSQSLCGPRLVNPWTQFSLRTVLSTEELLLSPLSQSSCDQPTKGRLLILFDS